MFGWFRKKTPKPLEPESRWVVSRDGEIISVRDPEGAVTAIAIPDLSVVEAETNDSGPWGIDFWWLLCGPGDQQPCAFPQGATGETGIIEYLSALPGFDHRAMIDAMGSTANRSFTLWRKPA